MRDPRSHRRYRDAARAWIQRHQPGHPCCLCGEPVDTRLPGATAFGPTVEHRLPIRTILATSGTFPQALELACDASLWGLAHRRCQDRQGAAVTNSRHRAGYVPSRDW